MTIKQISIAAGILLILAIPPIWPYGYYIFLRWAIAAAGAILAYNFYETRTAWALIFAFIAILFNPFMPFYLDKSAWVGIDLISATLFFMAPNSVNKAG